MASRFFGKHILSATQFTRKDVEDLCERTYEMRHLIATEGRRELLYGKMVRRVFYESSTRTGTSFDGAAKRLGAMLHATKTVQFSSVTKGEDLPDTLTTLSSNTSVLILRHPDRGSVELASRFSKAPLINAGDGDGEHPTQALLDVFTICDELGDIDGLTITLMGDLRFGRTIHALMHLLRHYRVKINLVSPEPLRLSPELMQVYRQYPYQMEQFSLLNDVIGETDVLYVTRAQYERFKDQPELEAMVRQAYPNYIVTPETLARGKKRMIVMHPFPRNDEIDRRVDPDPRAAYFRQIENGEPTRMTLLGWVLGAW